MKTKLRYGKIGKLILICLIGLPLAFNSCSKESTSESSKKESLSGKWTFKLSPDKSHKDTNMVKGIRGSEQDEYPAEINDIFLYEDNEGQIVGDHHYFRFKGKRDGNNVNIDVYSYKDGFVKEDVATSEMNLISSMKLTVDDYGNLKGSGYYHDSVEFAEAKDETYFVNAYKRNNISNAKQANALNTICDISSKVDSYVINGMTDGIFHPMGNCYLSKNGGGYYVFGHIGPGSLLPIYTQTIYYPFEWSWCKVRRYNFVIRQDGNLIELTALKYLIKHKPPTPDFHTKLGYGTPDQLNNAIDNFMTQYGDFAISLGYSVLSNNLVIYVNHTKGSDYGATHHPLVENLKGSYGPHFNKVYVYAGADITDHWYLRRSEVGVCNSPLLYCYVLGTMQIRYD